MGFIERERERERERDREGETEREILSMYAGPKVLRTKYKETLMGAVATYALPHNPTYYTVFVNVNSPLTMHTV